MSFYPFEGAKLMSEIATGSHCVESGALGEEVLGEAVLGDEFLSSSLSGTVEAAKGEEDAAGRLDEPESFRVPMKSMFASFQSL